MTITDGYGGMIKLVSAFSHFRKWKKKTTDMKKVIGFPELKSAFDQLHA
jgi:hypothetical protein